MSKLRHILYILSLAAFTSCEDKLDVISPDDAVINVGDEVRFSAHVPQSSTRATTAETEYWKHIGQFERVQEDYLFDVEMYEEGNAQKIASATYNPTKNTVGNVTTYDEYGTLSEAMTNKFLYWPSNVKRYAFHAISTNTTSDIADPSTEGKSDQTSFDKYISRDRIEGYGYVPGWDQTLNEGEGAPVRNLDGYNYMTSKEWYAANKAWGTPEGMTTNAQLVEHWKKIPLFMRHKRSRITVLLKAGEGVEREQIAFNEYTREHIAAEIYSYDDSNHQTIVKPLLGSYTCKYEATNLLPNEDVITACYDAIVNPHNYTEGANMTEQKLIAINLSGMKFSFYAANDKAYSSAQDATNEDVKTRYNLTEGKHLILEVTLSTDTRKILITAYVVDWEDWPFSSICDDFGQAADPLPINNKKELIDFLTDPNKNKPGNVGVILPLYLNLIGNAYTKETADLENKNHLVTDSNGKKPGEEGYVTTYEAEYSPVHEGDPIPGSGDAGWKPAGYDLKATLKLAGATITTDQRLFDKISASGSIVNGTVVIADQAGDGASNEALECAIAQTNEGMIERINVQKGNTTRRATQAGLVTTNYGTIYACTSQMPVYNAGGDSETLIGGIAAVMMYPSIGNEINTSALPVIDQCNVNARVDGGPNVKGGGIAGKAEGKLTNNTYEYGITLSQDPVRFKNILYAKGDRNQELTIEYNAWSTRVENLVLNGTTLINARPETDLYNQVIDSQEELKKLLNDGAYNNNSSRFRIADSFMVDDTWENLGIQNQPTGFHTGNLLCELNGNDKTITLTGTTYAQMLFSNIESHLYDFTLVLDKPIVAMPELNTEGEVVLTARAPLAYAVVGDNAILSNVKVLASDEAYVESVASSGLVVWAYDGATIEDCMSDVDVRIALPANTGDQQTYFVGGLVNSAAKATIVRCTYLRDMLNTTEDAHAGIGSNIYYGGIVGGTSTKGVFNPSLNISDCTSWLIWQPDELYPHKAWGGIIGYSKYGNSLSDLVNALDGNCQGNWWTAPAGASDQGLASGMTEEKAIGKKNSIQPTKPTSN